MKHELNEKQKAFCDYYLKSLNATDSYSRVYGTKGRVSESNGSRLLSHAKVRSYIDRRLQQMEDKRIADAQEVLQYLTSVVRDEITEQRAIVSKEGSAIVELKAAVSDRNKAAELLGKRYALFTEKKEVSGNVGVQIVDDIE